MAAPTYSYGRPPIGRPGQLSDIGPSFIESAICGEPAGLLAGTIVTISAVPENVTGLRSPMVIRAVDGTRVPTGFLLWNPGRVRAPSDVADVLYQEQCNVVRMGRIWLICETAITDPTATPDSFWFRKTAHGGLTILGQLRAGDGDPVSATPTATQFPANTIRPVTPCAAGGIGEWEFDFRNTVLIP